MDETYLQIDLSWHLCSFQLDISSLLIQAKKEKNKKKQWDDDISTLDWHALEVTHNAPEIGGEREREWGEKLFKKKER